MTWPKYLGPLAYGIRMGVVTPGGDLESMVLASLVKCQEDELLADGDVVCVTESVVARAQGNYVTLDQVAQEVRRTLSLPDDGCLGVVFPIASRNRFSLILRALARAVRGGRLVIQMSFPCDEVGNRVLDPDVLKKNRLSLSDTIPADRLPLGPCLHPVTGVDYLAMYRKIATSEGAATEILLANDPLAILSCRPDAVIAADIHSRHHTQAALQETGMTTITLKDLCRDALPDQGWSEWGLLGSNMASGDRLKLAPRDARGFAHILQARIKKDLGLEVEVIVYGDGAYKDPSTGIYELADPHPTFGATDGLVNRMRQGVKYKLFADMLLEKGMVEQEIEAFLAQKKQETMAPDAMDAEGTTPRRLEDIVASLADLVSGSADAGTPVVVVRGFLND